MRKFIVMAICARFVQRCGHKRCVRQEWNDRWYDYMFAVKGVERLMSHAAVLHEYYYALDSGRPATLDVRKLRLVVD